MCFFLPCSFWLISSPVGLLLLQRNWSCASVDGSPLPPTALAELSMGDPNKSAEAQPHPSPQLCTLLQLFSLLLLLGYIPALQRGSTLPVDKLDKVYENSKILTTRLYHRGNKATARANDATTMLRSLDNTNTLEEQRLRLHLETCRRKTNWTRLQNLCVWRCRWAKSPFPSPQVHGSSNPLVFCFRLFGVSSSFLCSVSWKRAKWHYFCQFTPDRHVQMLQSLP